MRREHGIAPVYKALHLNLPFPCLFLRFLAFTHQLVTNKKRRKRWFLRLLLKIEIVIIPALSIYSCYNRLKWAIRLSCPIMAFNKKAILALEIMAILDLLGANLISSLFILHFLAFNWQLVTKKRRKSGFLRSRLILFLCIGYNRRQYSLFVNTQDRDIGTRIMAKRSSGYFNQPLLLGFLAQSKCFCEESQTKLIGPRMFALTRSCNIH